MKRFLIIVLFIFGACTATYAGDLPETLITLPDTDVFIGEITEIRGDEIKISVSQALFSNYDVDTIILDTFEYMTDDNNNKIPKQGDYLAVAVYYKDNKWDIVYRDEHSGMAAKSDSLDPRTLQLYSGGNDFANRMNEYINDGTYSYERRVEALGASDITETRTPEADTKAGQGDSEDSDEQLRKIALETEIVIPPPASASSAADTKDANKTPLSWYLFLSALSMLVSFLFVRHKAAQTGARR